MAEVRTSGEYLRTDWLTPELHKPRGPQWNPCENFIHLFAGIQENPDHKG